MKHGLYSWIRGLHLYLGLFISPFVLVFAFSVFFLVHAWLPAPGPADAPRVVSDLPINAEIAALSGRARIDALKPLLDRIGAHGDVGWITYRPQEHRLIVPLAMPGCTTTVTFDLERREARVERRTTGLASAWVDLHKSPGPHLAGLRMNWVPLRIWRWFADATVYLLLFLSVSGVYLWYVLRSERTIGLCLLFAGAVSFFGLVYALAH